MTKLAPYAKAVWAFLASAVGLLSAAVMATPDRSLAEVGTAGWLAFAASVLTITGGVYGFSNKTDVIGQAVDQYRQAQATFAALGKEIAALNVFASVPTAAVPVQPPTPPVSAIVEAVTPPAPEPAPQPEPAAAVVPPGPVQVITPSPEVSPTPEAPAPPAA